METPATESETNFSRAVQLQEVPGTVLDACYTDVGDTLATVTDEGAVQIWECSVTEPQWQLLHTEQLPATPTQLAWAHAQFGACLAVGTEAGAVHILTREALPGAGSSSGSGSAGSLQDTQPEAAGDQRRGGGVGWCCTAVLPCGHEAVSALAFGPPRQGLVLAVACMERAVLESVLSAGAAGRSQVLVFEGGRGGSKLRGPRAWTLTSKLEVPEAAGACSCLCWHASVAGLPPLLAGGHSSGGCIWAYRPATMMWQELASFRGPPDAPGQLLALHWAPAMGRPHELLAASYGPAVLLYRVAAGGGQVQQQRGPAPGALDVAPLQELRHALPVWRLGFNALGNALACSLDGAPEVWLWMPSLDGTWQCVTKLAGDTTAPGGGGAEMVD